MKNMMRRTVAFMLMACLLLSVMAPVSLLKAEAVTTSGDEITYSIDGSASITSGSYLRMRTNDDKACGDLTYLAKGSGHNYVDLYASYIKVNSFDDADSTDGVITDWVALKFDVAEAGAYSFVASVSNGSANVHVEAFDETRTYDDNYVSSLTAHVVSGSKRSYYFNEGSYVLLVMAKDATAKNINITGITLTKIKAPETVSMTNGTYVYGTEYSGVTTATNGYITKANQKMGDFVLYDHSTHILQNASGSLIQAQSNQFANGNWFALSINVAAAGKYDVSLLTTDTKGQKAVDVYIVPLSSTFNIDSAYLDSLDGTEYAYATEAAAVNTFEGVELNAGNYLVIFRAENAGQYRFYGITLQPYTVKGVTTNTMYADVNTAIAAGETSIQLTAPVSQNIAVTNGAVLDLNGQTVYGTVSVVDGQIVDNAGNGGIVGTLDATGNQWLSLYDGTAYKFFSYTKNSGVRAEEATDYGYSAYYYDVELSQAAYELIATGESGIDVEVVVSWTGEESGSKTLALNQDNVKQWAQAEINGEEWGLKVQLTGVPEGVTGVTVDVTFTANGASIAF